MRPTVVSTRWQGCWVAHPVTMGRLPRHLPVAWQPREVVEHTRGWLDVVQRTYEERLAGQRSITSAFLLVAAVRWRDTQGVSISARAGGRFKTNSSTGSSEESLEFPRSASGVESKTVTGAVGSLGSILVLTLLLTNRSGRSRMTADRRSVERAFTQLRPDDGVLRRMIADGRLRPRKPLRFPSS